MQRRHVYPDCFLYGLRLFPCRNRYLLIQDRRAEAMIFINESKNATEAKDYYTRHLGPSDYYMKDAAELTGRWGGLGAELLGLKGEVKQEDFFALCDNLHPQTGEQLTPHTKENRRVLYDMTFDGPKFVSAAYAVGKDERVLDAFVGAMDDTQDEMERDMMTRVRKDGRFENRVTANAVRATFIHLTTRPLEDGIPDFQLHGHGTWFNATYDPVEEQFKAGEFSNFYRDKGYYQAAFHSRLARRLSDLGYGIERDGNSFRLIGIAPALMQRFSRRTEEIEATAERLGITDDEAKGRLGRKTRRKKDKHPRSMTELQDIWKSRMTAEEIASIVDARNKSGETVSLDAKGAMDYALAHHLSRRSTIPEKELMKTALMQSIGTASFEEVQAQLSRDNVIRKSKDGIAYVTTQEVRQQEDDIKDFVAEGRGKFPKLGGIDPLPIDAALGKEHQEAGRVILNSRDRVTALKGGAGTGKTTLIKAVVAPINRTGKEVFLFATSTDAVSVLHDEGFPNAQTVARLLADREMQDKIKNQVIWLDEGGLPSVPEMKGIFDIAREQNARVVISGDTAQHHGVECGDALRILELAGTMKTAELKEVRRQKNESYRAAVKAISEGDAVGRDGRTRFEAGMEMLDGMGAIIELPGETRHSRIAMDYAGVTAERRADGKFKTALVVSPTHKEGEQVTAAIRDELKMQDRLGKDERQFLSLRSLNLTDAQKGDFREYRPGAVVQFVQNAKGFARGERLTVEEGGRTGVRARRADGTMAMLPLNTPERFQLYEARQIALAPGDKLRTTMNGLVEQETRRGALGRRRKYRVNNGALQEVAGFTRNGGIRLANGAVLPKDYGGITHGYVVTSHASQGKTVDVSLVALGRESFAAASREQAYVSFSRGREALRIYTDDKAAMMDAIRASSARLSATELMQPEQTKRKPSFTQRMIQAGVIQRAYTAVRERMAAYAQTLYRHPQREGLGLEH